MRSSYIKSISVYEWSNYTYNILKTTDWLFGHDSWPINSHSKNTDACPFSQIKFYIRIRPKFEPFFPENQASKLMYP